MGTTLYSPGEARTIRGVKCNMKVFEDQAVSDALCKGWFYSPSDCYETKEDVPEPDKDDGIKKTVKQGNR